MRTRKKGRKQSLWKDEFYVEAFRLAKAGLSVEGIAAGLGVSVDTYRHWRKTRPAFKEAVRLGKKSDEEGASTFEEYVFDRLPPELQQVWKEIMECSAKGSPNAINRLERILGDCGRRGRQHILLHALIHCNFNLSEALRTVNMSRGQFDRWLVNDPGFAALVDEMDWHRKNFFEGKLYELVKAGEPALVKFVNQTYNADRGYGKRSTVEKNVNVTVTGTVRHSSVPIDELDLDLEAKKKLLRKIRKENE